MCISLKAHGLWHLALGRRLSAVGIELWGSRIELLGAKSCPVARNQGSLDEPLGAKWPPKAAKEDPKADTWCPKVAKARPDVAHNVPRSEAACASKVSGVPGRAVGRQVATQSRQRGPQSRHKAPQSRQNAPRRRPQGAQQRKMTKKRLRSMAPSSAEP